MEFHDAGFPFFSAAFWRISSSLALISNSSSKSALSRRKLAKWSVGSSGTILQSSMRPSVKWGTTLSIKYWRIGWERVSSKSLSCSLISSSFLASALYFFSRSIFSYSSKIYLWAFSCSARSCSICSRWMIFPISSSSLSSTSFTFSSSNGVILCFSRSCC